MIPPLPPQDIFITDPLVNPDIIFTVNLDPEYCPPQFVNNCDTLPVPVIDTVGIFGLDAVLLDVDEVLVTNTADNIVLPVVLV